MKIKACPKCGSKNISMGALGDGVLFGIDSWKEVCRNCNYQGAPILFDSEVEYKKFFSELNLDNNKKVKENKNKSIKKDDSDLLDKSEEKEVNVRWRIFLISVALSFFITLLFVPNFLSIYDLPMHILRLIGQFIITLFTVVVLILFIRFLILGGKYK